MFHLIATKTVLPSLKSAREFCSKPRPPEFLLSSDDPQECWDKAASIYRGLKTELLLCLRGMPVFQTADWTYYIVQQR